MRIFELILTTYRFPSIRLVFCSIEHCFFLKTALDYISYNCNLIVNTCSDKKEKNYGQDENVLNGENKRNFIDLVFV